ncbi:hypothetical protein EDC04DRAFT_1249536 [Pisolithus marmoratus]|nr:hypothetical protein EDC04DRAFT_1249536 [Pisolithus marmoratus]
MAKLADLEYAKHVESETIHDVRTGRAFKSTFRFNPLHDMVSIWWIPTWVLYYHVDQDGSQPSMGQSTCFNETFPGRPDSLSPHEAEDVHQVMTTYVNSEKEMPPVEELAHTEPLKNLHSISAEYLTSAVEYSRGVILAPAPRRSTAWNPTPEATQGLMFLELLPYH